MRKKVLRQWTKKLTPLLMGVSIGFILAFMPIERIMFKFTSRAMRQRLCQDGGRLSVLNSWQNLLPFVGTSSLDIASRYRLMTSSADKMAHEVRVLCWIMTHPANHAKKAKEVKATWGRRCNTLLFFSTTNDTSLPTIPLPIEKEDREHLWAKTKAAFKYIYQHHLNDAEWFLKADDDTYVVVENLRHMLSSHSPKDPIWFGSHFKAYVPKGYMAGGAGYVLSKEALRRFAKVGLPNKKSPCARITDHPEDLTMGFCMQSLRVRAEDSRDHQGRPRFFPVPVSEYFIPGSINETVPWLLQWAKHHIIEGPDCCSDTAIAFHYIPPAVMHMIDFLLYRMKPVLPATVYISDTEPAANKSQ